MSVTEVQQTPPAELQQSLPPLLRVNMKPEELPEEFVAKAEQFFHLYDKEKTGRVNLPEVGAALRALGLNPSEAELAATFKDVEPEQPSIEFSRFLEFYCELYHEPPTEEQVVEAFAQFDPDGTGSISKSEFAAHMSSIGESLTQEEIDKLFADIEADENGLVSIQELTRLLTAT